MRYEDISKSRELVNSICTSHLSSQQNDELQVLLARAQYSYEDGKILGMQDDAYIREVTSDLFVRKDYMVVFLPINAEVIGEGAFEGFTNLVAIIVGDKLKHIEERAFIDCKNLSNIVIPSTCTYSDSSFTEDCSVVNNTLKCKAVIWKDNMKKVR